MRRFGLRWFNRSTKDNETNDSRKYDLAERTARFGERLSVMRCQFRVTLSVLRSSANSWNQQRVLAPTIVKQTRRVVRKNSNTGSAFVVANVAKRSTGSA